MSATDAAQEILRREQAEPGSVPPALLAKATQLAGQGQGSMRLPEQTIQPTQNYKTSIYGDIVGNASDRDIQQMADRPPPGRFEQAATNAMRAGFVGANEFANAGGLGIPQATGMIPGGQDPAYAAERQAHPIAALGGQIGGLMAGGNPANLAARGAMGGVRAAAPGLAGSLVGRAALGAGEGALAGGMGAGAITASAGGTGDQIFDSAATGAGIGGVLGAGGQLLQEPGRWLKGLLQGPRGGQPNTGQMLPPAGPPGASAPSKPLPGIPDLEVPPRPEPMAAAAPHAPTEPLPDLSTVHRPPPGDTGMGVEEARRALDTEALHMANRSAAVTKLVDVIPPGADAAWLAKMTAEERAALADFVGVQQAGDDTWRAVSDVLDQRAAGPSTKPSPPLPRESELARRQEADLAARMTAYHNRPPMDSASPTARIGPSDTPMPPIPGPPGLPTMNPAAIQMAMRAMRGGGKVPLGPLGIDPMLGALMQSPQFVNAVGMAGGAKIPQATNRPAGAPPIDLLSLY